MIKIIESKSKKIVGLTSLFVSFEFNKEIVDVIHNAGDCLYDNKSKLWEAPLNKLAYLIDNLSVIDDLDVQLIKDEEKEHLNLVCEYKLKPYKYQSEGIEWLINNKNGLLLDVPGLGKTMQIIYAAEELKQQNKAEHCLIICGVNSLKENWASEINKFSNLSCRVLGKKISKTGKVSYGSIKDRADELLNKIDDFFIITNIETIRSDDIINSIIQSENNFDIIVVDELHKAKSTKSDQGKGLLQLSKIGKYHFGLTGTILTNSPLDAYMPLKFVGGENANLTNFKNFYCNIGVQFGHQTILSYKNLDYLKSVLSKCSIRRTKELLDLPSKTIIPEIIELSDKHYNFYKNIQEGIVDEADRVDIKTTSLLGLVVRLRQASSCPNVLSSQSIINNKIERCLDLVDEIIESGEKVVIFSTFKEPIYNLCNRLKSINPLICTGDQNDQIIVDNINKFQTDDSYKVLLATTSKLGTGVTLTAASYAIFIDTPWTDADFSQACDRVHRVGSKKPVTIYNLIGKDTIDERCWKLVNRKKGISDFIVDDIKTQNDDIRELLGLKSFL